MAGRLAAAVGLIGGGASLVLKRKEGDRKDEKSRNKKGKEKGNAVKSLQDALASVPVPVAALSIAAAALYLGYNFIRGKNKENLTEDGFKPAASEEIAAVIDEVESESEQISGEGEKEDEGEEVEEDFHDGEDPAEDRSEIAPEDKRVTNEKTAKNHSNGEETNAESPGGTTSSVDESSKLPDRISVLAPAANAMPDKETETLSRDPQISLAAALPMISRQEGSVDNLADVPVGLQVVMDKGSLATQSTAFRPARPASPIIAPASSPLNPDLSDTLHSPYNTAPNSPFPASPTAGHAFDIHSDGISQDLDLDSAPGEGGSGIVHKGAGTSRGLVSSTPQNHGSAAHGSSAPEGDKAGDDKLDDSSMSPEVKALLMRAKAASQRVNQMHASIMEMVQEEK